MMKGNKNFLGMIKFAFLWKVGQTLPSPLSLPSTYPHPVFRTQTFYQNSELSPYPFPFYFIFVS
jgi:hypothetical protein